MKEKRHPDLTHNFPILTCLRAAMEIDEQIRGDKTNYSSIKKLSEILEDETRTGGMLPGTESVLRKVLPKYTDIKTIEDLTREAYSLALELKPESVRKLPEDRLKVLGRICFDLAKEIVNYRNRINPYPTRHFLVHA